MILDCSTCYICVILLYKNTVSEGAMGLCLIEQDYMTISDFINSLNETDKTKYSVRTFERCNRTAIDFIRKYGLSSDGGHKHSGVIHIDLNQYKDERKNES